MGVAPCVMDGGGTSIGVACGAVNDGWGASCGRGGVDGGLQWDGGSKMPVGRDSAGDCCGMEGVAGV